MTADPPREVLARRLNAAGVLEDRLIDVIDGQKKSPVTHADRANRYGTFAALDGNYGVYAGPTPDRDTWLIDVDIDDYSTDGDADGGLAAVLELPETLTVETPHTDGETGGHRFYVVEDPDLPERIRSFLGRDVVNPTVSWGEVRVEHQYVVGPGSQLDGCDKVWCDECATPDGGRYEIATDAPIAEIATDDLLDVLRADGLGDSDSDSDSGATAGGDADEADEPDEYTPIEADGRAERVAKHDERIKQYLGLGAATAGFTGGGGGDRSDADWYVCCRMIEYGVDEAQARDLLNDSPRTKVNERGPEYWTKTWRNARRHVGDDAGTERLPGDTLPPAAVADETSADGGAVAEDGAEGAAGNGQGSPSTGEADQLSPTALLALAGIGLGEDQTPQDAVGDLSDREAAAYVWALVKQSDDIHIRVRRDNDEVWAYDTDRGVWTPEGERALRDAARRALTSVNYGANVLTELLAQARADRSAEVLGRMFGLEPGQLAVANGVVDLAEAADGAGEDALRDLEPEDYALARLPVEYDPDAEYDEWADYVDEWAEDGRADALQEYVGYCLHIGAMPIHRALLLVGSGANGKGTFLTVIRALLGRDNTSSIELQTLANEKDAVADFYGAIANIDDDLSARKLGRGVGMFKKLVGGDRVRARRLYEDGFEFDAVGKHLYAANEVPQVDVPDEDEAFWRRWLLVEFPNHYPPGERDHELSDKLTDADILDGVLNWAIEGRRRLLEQGYFTNEEHYPHAKRERWQAWGESVDKFISECVENDPDAPRLSTQDAHRRYAAWCRENSEDPVGQRKLTNKLKNEDVDYGRHRIGGKVKRGYKALGLSDDVPELEDTPGRDPDDDHQDSLF